MKHFQIPPVFFLAILFCCLSGNTCSGKTKFPFTDMVLCYGGSPHRGSHLWDEDRFSRYVTYTDEKGKEHWLFDAFLCLEFQSTKRADGKNYSFYTGMLKGTGESAGKAQWQELIDYWFSDGSGFEALDRAVGAAEKRIGHPATRRKVVVSMPDPILHLYFDKLDSPTRYWGQLDGKDLDFAVTADRVAAYKWFIDQVRDRFRRCRFKNIQLEGFYIISEDLATPDQGWSYEMKKLDVVIPEVSDYIHSGKEKLYWIPYRGAAGYKRGAQFKIDYVWMQPNYYWKGEASHPLDETFKMITEAGTGMEFELDEALMEGRPDCGTYRDRFRQYMEYSRRYGLYGKTPFTYYVGGDAVNSLSRSSNALDKAFYNELCHFIIEDPLRKEH